MQPGEPLSPTSQGPRQQVAAAGAVLVLGPIGLGGLSEQLGHLSLKVGVGAVGRGRGVGLNFGAIPGDQPQADQSGRRAQLPRLDQQPSQRLFVTDAKAGDVT